MAELGKTRVLCVATVEKGVPDACREKGTGWIQAEYNVLPTATAKRQPRGSRQAEYDLLSQKLGAALRGVTDLHKMDGVTITLDCDVLQADGDPMGAAIAGSGAALYLALKGRMAEGYLRRMPMGTQIAAVSAGICQGEPVLDPGEKELSQAEAVLTVWMTGQGEILQVYRTGEGRPISKGEMEKLLSLCKKGTGKLCREQKKITGELT